jgi:hypothetical protein
VDCDKSIRVGVGVVIEWLTGTWPKMMMMIRIFPSLSSPALKSLPLKADVSDSEVN